MGWLSDRVGLNRALVFFSTAMAVLSAVVAVVAVRTEEIAVALPA
jgi:nitrate/nitrite transporter NarK